MELWVFVTRLFFALILGMVVGTERQWRQRSAGLRTNTLVTLGATAFVILSIRIGGDATGRIASYIVSGIGFLGAGVIMKDGMNIQGLNTAATIWCSAAVGSLIGIGLYVEASVLAFAIVITHTLLRPVGLLLNRLNFAPSHDENTDYLIRIKSTSIVENHIRVLLIQMLGNEVNLLLKSLTSDDTEEDSNVVITAVVKSAKRQDSLIERVVSRLTIEEQVYKASWEITGHQDDL